MIDSLIDGVMVAAIYIGAKDPYNMTPDEVATTKEALQEQIPLLRFYSNSMTEVEQALASGELVAAVTWNASALELSNQGLPVRFMVPKEGAMTWTCGGRRAHRRRAWERGSAGWGRGTAAGS